MIRSLLYILNYFNFQVYTIFECCKYFFNSISIFLCKVIEYYKRIKHKFRRGFSRSIIWKIMIKIYNK